MNFPPRYPDVLSPTPGFDPNQLLETIPQLVAIRQPDKSLFEAFVWTKIFDNAEKEEKSMFNFLVTFQPDGWAKNYYEWEKGRILEYTEETISNKLEKLS